MALIIYPTTNYDTFCLLADAETILLNNIPLAQRTSWDALADADKEILLRQSTLLIETRIVKPSTLESNLQKACAFLANYSVNQDMTNSDGKTGNIKVKEIVDVVKTEYFNASKDSDSFPSIVSALLKGYGVTTSSTFTFNRG